MRSTMSKTRFARIRAGWLLVSLGLVIGAEAAPVLVDGAWLEPRLEDRRLVIVDMSEEPIQYARFHIPGAVRLDYSALFRRGSRGKPNRRLTDPEFAALLGSLGIGLEHHVVIYDDMGGLNAGRLFLELERFRHPNVSVLNGGLVQWILDHRRVTNQPVTRVPVPYAVPSEIHETLASADDARHAGTNGVALLDVRTQEEYVGDPKEPRSGHIPGARWWPWEQAIRMDKGFVIQDANTLVTSINKAGIADRKAPVVLYCRTGHRASQTYLTLRHLGYENVRMFAGSMLEYQLDPSAPVRRGNHP